MTIILSGDFSSLVREIQTERGEVPAVFTIDGRAFAYKTSLSTGPGEILWHSPLQARDLYGPLETFYEDLGRALECDPKGTISLPGVIDGRMPFADFINQPGLSRAQLSNLGLGDSASLQVSTPYCRLRWAKEADAPLAYFSVAPLNGEDIADPIGRLLVQTSVHSFEDSHVDDVIAGVGYLMLDDVGNQVIDPLRPKTCTFQ